MRTEPRTTNARRASQATTPMAVKTLNP